jgi:hypothetical protein
MIYKYSKLKNNIPELKLAKAKQHQSFSDPERQSKLPLKTININAMKNFCPHSNIMATKRES